ncbi:hypothetical protein L1887_58079 [Cichorium endivia]|nr:hypothetical protein L1887_58079 [Cichorium endivia]
MAGSHFPPSRILGSVANRIPTSDLSVVWLLRAHLLVSGGTSPARSARLSNPQDPQREQGTRVPYKNQANSSVPPPPPPHSSVSTDRHPSSFRGNRPSAPQSRSISFSQSFSRRCSSANLPSRRACWPWWTLSLTVAAALDPIEQHLLARDGDVFSQSKAASGKHATPVNLSNVQASKQAVLKLVGDDLHTPTQSETLLEDSKIAVPGDVAAQLGDRAHCSLGHDSANIKRIRYEMTVQIDRDESGSSTEASSESVRGTVVKATSGLYSDANPDKGACAKSLARHGETCVNRPYIVPQSALPDPSESKASGAAGGKLGKRGLLAMLPSDGKVPDKLDHLCRRCVGLVASRIHVC